MRFLNWSLEKERLLKRERGISFAEVALLIEAGEIIAVEEHPGRPGQRIYVLEIDGYAVVVPFVEDGDEIFLKTIFPSRKYTRKYDLREGMTENG